MRKLKQSLEERWELGRARRGACGLTSSDEISEEDDDDDDDDEDMS